MRTFTVLTATLWVLISSAWSQSRPPLPFTSVVQVGDDYYFSGWGSRNPETRQHPEGFEAQTRQLMVNLKNLLARQDLTFEHVVHSSVLLTDPNRINDFHTIYREFFPGRLPAMNLAAIPRLPDTEVEITFVASRRPSEHLEVPATAANVPASPAVRQGNLLYLSASALLQASQSSSGLETQVEQALQQLGRVLEAAGMSYSDVVKSEVYLTDIQRIQEMNRVYQRFFPEEPPTRTTVGVTALPGGAQVSISLVASSQKQVVVPEGITPSPNFSPAIYSGDRLFLSGKAGFAEGGVEPQVHEVMQSLGKSLAAAGLDFSHVVEAKVYLGNMEDYHRMNAAYRQYYPEGFPARTCTQVQGLVRNSTVEVTLVADRTR